MLVKIKQLGADGVKVKEYSARALKCSGLYLALDIEGIGWRTIETDLRNISFEVVED